MHNHLHDLIECAERELLRRKRDYPNKINTRRMTPQRAERELALMEAIIEQLRVDAQRRQTIGI